MHKLVATTFKILAMSMLLMFLLDTSLLLIEVITINSKVSNMMSIIQTEVARNNCLPTTLADGYLDYFSENIATPTSRVVDSDDIYTNFKNNLTIDSNTYDALTPENAKEYGEFVYVAVAIKLHPAYVYFNLDRSNANSNATWLTRGMEMPITLQYVYSVPCLRYLK